MGGGGGASGPMPLAISSLNIGLSYLYFSLAHTLTHETHFPFPAIGVVDLTANCDYYPVKRVFFLDKILLQWGARSSTTCSPQDSIFSSRLSIGVRNDCRCRRQCSLS